MTLSESLQSIVGAENVLTDEPMSLHTTFKIGGPAKFYVMVSSEEEMRKLSELLRKEEITPLYLGRGSNLLVSDKGLSTVVISLHERFTGINFEPETEKPDGSVLITAESGALLSSVSFEAAKRSLTGLEFASGIPGTIGGGIFMNAGAYDSFLSDITESVKVLLPSGEIATYSKEEMAFSYRHSILMENHGIVLSVTLKLQPGNSADIEEKMNLLRDKRTNSQPLSYPSAGSVFKRPEGHFAGALIEEAGLKGTCVGDAIVSEKHAGFIVNCGKATAEDVRKLICLIQDTVMKKTGILLEPEIEMAGEFECPLRQP